MRLTYATGDVGESRGSCDKDRSLIYITGDVEASWSRSCGWSRSLSTVGVARDFVGYDARVFIVYGAGFFFAYASGDDGYTGF